MEKVQKWQMTGLEFRALRDGKMVGVKMLNFVIVKGKGNNDHFAISERAKFYLPHSKFLNSSH